MNGNVLILNQDFRALTVCSVQKAFVLLYLNKAEMVSKEDNSWIRSVSLSFPMPTVIRLHNFVKAPFKSVHLNRQNIFRRDNFTCQYCGVKHDLTLDHVFPRSRGGATSWENLITACKRCNGYKGNRTPQEADMVLRYKPFRPSFVMYLRNFVNVTSREDWDLFLGKSAS